MRLDLLPVKARWRIEVQILEAGEEACG